ncbi:MAG: hypothetical protein KJZ85_11675 [Rhodobacteraceae bacterium]|jgi:hypothetical protein|nr:hypothetical protein [Paracoccaceae bacterium]
MLAPSPAAPSSPLSESLPVRAWRWLAGAIGMFLAAARAAADAERLSAMSDADLAREGLRRSDLAATVYARHFGR